MKKKLLLISLIAILLLPITSFAKSKEETSKYTRFCDEKVSKTIRFCDELFFLSLDL